MKKIKLLAAAVAALACSLPSNAQTADEVINSHITAMGGKEKLKSINTVRFEGTMNAMGQDVGITITKQHETGQRVDISVMGMTGYQINTPTAGWNFMPFAGQSAPEAIPDEEVKARQSQLDLHGTFTDYQEKGVQVELQGKETVENEECHKLKATFKSGNSSIYYISAKTFYLVKSTATRTVQGQEMEIATVYSNYKATPDGYIFAHTTSTPNGDINFEKIEVNKPVDAKLFSTE